MRPLLRIAIAAICLLLISVVSYLNLSHISSSFDRVKLRLQYGNDGAGSTSAVDDDNPEWSVAPEKAIVMAKMQSEDTNWVHENLPDWHLALYYMDAPAPPSNPESSITHHTPPLNKGREAMAYLTFLITHYSRLPATIAFLHSHRDGWPVGWHTDAQNYDNVDSLRRLRIDYVQKEGYANLRCLHVPGCPDEIQPFREPRDEERKAELAIRDAWAFMFGNDAGSSSSNRNGGTGIEVPKVIAAACCSQFAASRNQVLQRPREDYIRFRRWLIDTDLEDEHSGRVMEYLWHIYFGRDAVQ